MTLAALLAGAGSAQGLPGVPSRPGWPPVPRVSALPGGLLPVTDTVVRRTRNVYTVLEVSAPALYGRPVRVQGYSLDMLLRWHWPGIQAWAQAGFLITFSGESGSVTLSLRDVYGHGGVLAYALDGAPAESPWPDAQAGQRRVAGSEVGYALVWPQTAPATLPQPWGLRMITVRPPGP
ncbi:hypothetical protein CVO96_06940 [Deinococcus koreensis]|uniref:Uncharacterized protein n=1 Tax=Deinococcus koreensis TaxID=2054903 RepID=A0A2K3UX95_9DEIO|nr:hypothetical protein CVO96_06940 [Deinococcus koreensis]